MQIKNNQQGFGILLLVLVLVIIGIVSSAGIYVYNSHKNTKSANELDNESYKPKDFGDCLRAGGLLQYNNPPDGSGYPEPDTDNSIHWKSCKYPKAPPDFPVVDDTQCKDKQRCLDIQQAAQGICNELAQGKNFSPTFKYYPVVKDKFVRLYLTDCSASHLKNDIVATLILRKTDEQWQIFKKFTTSVPCSEVDGAGIPLELVTTCIDQSEGQRIPK